jgi:hypothetical protein
MKPSRRFVFLSALAAAGASLFRGAMAGSARTWTVEALRYSGFGISLREGLDTQLVEADLIAGDGERLALRITPRLLKRLVGAETTIEAVIGIGDVGRKRAVIADWRVALARAVSLPPDWVPPETESASAFASGFPSPMSSVFCDEKALYDDHAAALYGGRPLPQLVAGPEPWDRAHESAVPIRPDRSDGQAPALDARWPIRVEPSEGGMEWRVVSHEFPDGKALDLRYRIEEGASWADKAEKDAALQYQLGRAIQDRGAADLLAYKQRRAERAA